MQRVLNSRGWINLYNARSGVLWKHGCILVLGSVCDYSLDNRFPCNMKLHYIDSKLVMTSAQSWYVERAGRLLDMGTLSAAILKSVDIERKSNGKPSEFVNFINNLDLIASYSDERAYAVSYAWTDVTTPAQGTILVESAESVMTTGFFKLQIKLTDDEDLFVGSKWMLKSIGDSTGNPILQFVRVDDATGKVLIATGDIEVPLEKLEELNKAKAIISLHPVERMVPHVEQILAKRNIASTIIGDIPKALRRFCIGRDRQMAIARCIGCVNNVTPLLFADISNPGQLASITTAVNCDCSSLQHFNLGAEGISDLSFILQSNLNLDYFSSEFFSERSLHFTLNTLISQIDDITETNHLSDFDKIIAMSLMSYGILVNDSDTVFRQYAKFYGERFGVSRVIEQMLAKGVEIDNSIVIPVNSLTDKMELIQFLRLDNFNLAEKSWNSIILNIMSKALYAYFDFKHGLVVSYSGCRIGRDFNSIVVYNNGYSQLWRAVSINEETVCYGYSNGINSITSLFV